MAQRYTEKEDKIILELIQQNPKNIKKACREAAVQLGRSPEAIYFRYFAVYRKTQLVYTILTPQVMVTNNLNTSKKVKSIWNTLESIARKLFFRNK